MESQQNHPSPSPASWGAETAHAPDAWRVGDAPSARIRASRNPRADPTEPWKMEKTMAADAEEMAQVVKVGARSQ
jgi:hypothetical protein